MDSLKIALNRLNKEISILKKETIYHCYYTTNKHRPEIEETLKFKTNNNEDSSLFFNIYCIFRLESSYYIIKLEWSLKLGSKIYPFGPPDLYFLTDNPYTLTNTKICNSFTKYHSDDWIPSLTVDQIISSYIEYYNSTNEAFTSSLGFIGVKHKNIDSLKKDVEKFKDNSQINFKLIEIIFPEVYEYLKKDKNYDIFQINFFNEINKDEDEDKNKEKVNKVNEVVNNNENDNEN